MSRELSLEEIHSISLEILIKIKQICDSEGIDYWLTYGTLIGAVRHKGFIPWDDDVDIAMKRRDFNKFVGYCVDHQKDLMPYKLFSFESCEDFFFPIARFSDTRYRLIDECGSEQNGLGLFVDIYPFDNCIPGDRYFYKKREKILRSIFLNYKCNIKIVSQSITKLLFKKRIAFLLGCLALALKEAKENCYLWLESIANRIRTAAILIALYGPSVLIKN